MTKETKIYIAAGLLAAVGAAAYFRREGTKQEQAAHAPASSSGALPTVAPEKDQTERITRLEVVNGDKGKVVLEKKADGWELVEPIKAKANGEHVKKALENLRELKVKEVVEKGGGAYDRYDLGEKKGIRVTGLAGGEKLVDLTFGKAGERGQMVRIDGREGVFALEKNKFQSFMFTRDAKNWRDNQIAKVEEANVVGVEVSNKEGLYSLSKNGETWSATFAKREGDKLAEKPAAWDKFDPAKVKDFLRAYKTLTAVDYADDKADTGLDKPEEHGGIVKLTLKDNAGALTFRVGKTAKAKDRYVLRDGGDGTIYVVSSWAADWAIDATKFEKKDDKKGDKKDAPPGGEPGDDALGDMPPLHLDH